MEISMAGPVTGASGTKTVVLDRTTDFTLIATGLDGRQVSSERVTVNVSEQVTPIPTPPAPITTSPPVKAVSLWDQLFNVITLISILSVIVIIVLGLLLRYVYLKRWASPEVVSAPVAVQKEEPLPKEIPEPAAEPSVPTRAKLTLPGGLEVRITTNSQVIGRAELARALGLDELGLISRKQFIVTCQDGEYHIEDTGSANGTKLNSEDIKGKGPMALKDGDIIDAAGAISLKFFVNES